MIKDLSDTKDRIFRLHTQVIRMLKAVLQNRMTSDVLTATRSRMCAITQAKCYVYVPGYH